jgi:hypothetical protein
LADYDAFKFGGVSYPLTASTSNTLLRDADPSLYWALQYWSNILQTYIGARLTAQAALPKVNLTLAAVRSTAHYDPGPFLLEHPENTFPILAAYRMRTRITERTVTWLHEESEWGVQYILPCLNWIQSKELLPILHAAGHVLVNRTEQGFDPGYTSGAKVWSSTHAGLESIAFTEYSFGRHEDANGLYYHAFMGQCLVKERVSPAAGDLEALAGIDVNEQIKDVTTMDAVVEFDTDVEPPEPGA